MSLKATLITAHDTEDNWNQAALAGFVPAAGQQIIYESDESHPYIRLKIGDGKTNIKNLPFFIEQPAEDSATKVVQATIGEPNENGFIVLDGGKI